MEDLRKVFKMGGWNKGLKGYTNKGSFKKGQHSGDKNPAKRIDVRKKISSALINHPIYKNKERSLKLSIARKKEYKNGRIPANKGKKRNDDVKRKIRITKQKRFIALGIPSSIGKNEKQILDKLEKSIGFTIIRQYPILGYYIDGYIPELNLAIEIDESHHKNRVEKDIKRENAIKQELNCIFIRVEVP